MSRRPYDLTGLRILITGAAGGIGAETARLCADLGASLLLTDRADLASLADELSAKGVEVRSLEADLMDPAAIREIASFARGVDAAVLGAGLYRPVDWSEDNWPDILEATLATNLKAPLLLAREIAEDMAERRRGRLVLVGSIVATTGGSFPNVGPHYAVSKGGLHTFVRWLAARYTPLGVQANGVAPGVTETAMITTQHKLDAALARHPMQRAARPDEIAWPIAFLCSPGASFISGAILDVNGGSAMRS